MKITNSLSFILQTPTELQTKYSLHQKSSQSKGCCTRVLDAIKSIFNRFLDCLKCIFCCSVKKYSSEDASSTNKTQTLAIRTTQVKKKAKEEKETQTLNKSETGSKEKPSLQKEESKASLEKKSTPQEKPVNYDKEIAEIQELVKSAPVHPWGEGSCGKDLCAREIYQNAQNILVKIKNPQSRFEAYIRFADSILKPVLDKLNKKYPPKGIGQVSGSSQSAQDAITAFDYLLQVRKNCLEFSSEESRQLKGGTFVHKSYLPTRLNIQLLEMTAEWGKKKDEYWDDATSRIYSFLVREELAGWNQRSTFFKIFQDNFVDFRS